MKTIKLGKHVVEIFDSPEDFPMKRYQRFNKFLAKDCEIGSDFSDFNKRSLKTIEYLKKDMKDAAIKELENRRMMVYNAFMEFSPKNNALAILVHSIDGVIKKDISSDGLEKILSELDEIGFTQKISNEITIEVKKKWNWFLEFISKVSTGIQKRWNSIMNYLKN